MNFLYLLITQRTGLSGTCQHWPRADPVWPRVCRRRSPVSLSVRRRSMSPTLIVMGSEHPQGAVNNPHHLFYTEVTSQPSFVRLELLAETLQIEKEQLDLFIFLCSICIAGLLLIVNIETDQLDRLRQTGHSASCCLWCTQAQYQHPSPDRQSYISSCLDLRGLLTWRWLFGNLEVVLVSGSGSWGTLKSQKPLLPAWIISRLMSNIFSHSSLGLFSVHQWTHLTLLQHYFDQ